MPANFPYLPYALLAIGVGVLGGIHIPINGALGGALLIVGAILAVHEPRPPEPAAVETTAGIELPH